MKKLWIILCLLMVNVASVDAAGSAARSAAKKLSKQATKAGARQLGKEALEAGARKANDAIRLSARNANNWKRLESITPDNVPRRSFSTKTSTDNVARVGLRQGDNVIDNLSAINRRRNTVTRTAGVSGRTARLNNTATTSSLLPTFGDGSSLPNRAYRQTGTPPGYASTTTDSVPIMKPNGGLVMYRIKRVEAPELKLVPGRENLRNNYLQRGRLKEMGYNIRDNDDAGHLLAHRFGGSNINDNIVPMSSKINRPGKNGKWYNMEERLAEYLESGKKVTDFRVDLAYSPLNSTRPSRFMVRYELDGIPVKPLLFRN